MKQNLKCPYCSARHWIKLYNTSSLVYAPIEYINGKVTTISDPNTTCMRVRCLECNKEFDIYKKNRNM